MGRDTLSYREFPKNFLNFDPKMVLVVKGLSCESAEDKLQTRQRWLRQNPPSFKSANDYCQYFYQIQEIYHFKVHQVIEISHLIGTCRLVFQMVRG